MINGLSKHSVANDFVEDARLATFHCVCDRIRKALQRDQG